MGVGDFAERGGRTTVDLRVVHESHVKRRGVDDAGDELEQHTPRDISYEVTNQTVVLENREPGEECRLETTLLVTVK